LAHHSKKIEITEAPQIEGSILKYREFLPLWSMYIGERRTAFAKASGTKSEVLLRTLWGKPKISIPEIGCHYFWPRLIGIPKNTLPIWC
jgi:hypothetical protein